MKSLEFRASILAAFGASGSETEELLAYNNNVFDKSCLALPIKFPLPPETHVSTWENYLTEAREIGLFSVLQKRLVQLRFPILENLSQTDDYQSVTRKGIFSRVVELAILKHCE